MEVVLVLDDMFENSDVKMIIHDSRSNVVNFKHNDNISKLNKQKQNIEITLDTCQGLGCMLLTELNENNFKLSHELMAVEELE